MVARLYILYCFHVSAVSVIPSSPTDGSSDSDSDSDSDSEDSDSSSSSSSEMDASTTEAPLTSTTATLTATALSCYNTNVEATYNGSDVVIAVDVDDSDFGGYLIEALNSSSGATTTCLGVELDLKGPDGQTVPHISDGNAVDIQISDDGPFGLYQLTVSVSGDGQNGCSLVIGLECY